MASTTTLNFDLFARDHASSTFSRFGGTVDRSERSVGLLRGSLGRLAGAFVGLGVIYKTTQFLSESVDEAREANKVGAQTEAVLKSTKGAARLTADEIGNLADKLSLKAGIDDEVIQSGENVLLTFRNIRDEVGKGNDIFTRATAAALDMSVAMGTDLKSANIQLGKALNDPIAGITALTRVGVSFTTKQKDTIKALVETGDTLGAQKIILRELNKEFKGSAKAQADPADKARVAWENLQETIGQKLVPILDRVLVWFVKDGLPAIEKFGSFLSATLGPVVSKVAGWFSGASESGGQLSTALSGLVAAGTRLYDALKPVAIDVFEAIKRNWPQIQATISGVLNAVSGVITAFADMVSSVWDKWGDEIMTVVGTTFQFISTAIRGALRVIQGIIQLVTGIITGDWDKAWKGIKNIVGGAVDVIKGYVRNIVSNAKQALANLGGALKGIIDSAWNKAKSATLTGIGKVVHWVETLPTKIVRAVGNLGMLLFDAGADVINGLIDGIKSKFAELQSTMDSGASLIKASLKSALGISSPSKVMRGYGEDTMQGLIDGIRGRMRDLKSAMGDVTDSIKSAFSTSVFGQGLSDADSMKQFARGQLNTVKRLLSDIRKLAKWGLSDSLMSQLVNSGDFAGIHALATSSRGDVRQLNRINAQTQTALNRAGDIAGRTIFGDELARQERALERAVKKGMDGARIKIDDDRGNARLIVRGG